MEIKPNSQGKEESLSIENLIDVKEWQKIQNNFSAVTGVCVRTLNSKGALFTLPATIPRLCSEVLKDSPFKSKICGNCAPTFLGGNAILDKNLSFVCEAGLYNFFAPLVIGAHVFGYIIVGPLVLVMRKSRDEYRRIAEALDVELSDFWDALMEIKVVSFHTAQALLEVIKDIAEYSLRLSFQSAVRRKEEVLSDVIKLRRLLDALLDVAFQISEADVGSIMLLDRDAQELSISVARGIPDEIVRRTRVRVGEGISGVVAQEAHSLILDDNLEHNRIRPYLNRPYISSSMVIPIKTEGRVFGVMNLGALKSSAVSFNRHTVQLIDRLINLATIAIHE